LARDPYQELGVSRTATADEIRKAFRKLAKAHHPDANPGDKKAEEKFKQVSAAFDIVGDAAKRKKFDLGQIDADGRETMRGFGGAPGNGPFNAGGFGRGGFRPDDSPELDLSELFGGVFGGGGRGPFGGGGQAGGFAPKGGDVKARLDIDLEDAIAAARSAWPSRTAARSTSPFRPARRKARPCA
jgi:DnaJ-class molecular chaperone